MGLNANLRSSKLATIESEKFKLTMLDEIERSKKTDSRKVGVLKQHLKTHTEAVLAAQSRMIEFLEVSVNVV